MKDPRMIFGFLLLAMLAVLAGVIALGKVDELHSYGLKEIISSLDVVAGGWAVWAFGKTDKGA